jgi:hypothetical protein
VIVVRQGTATSAPRILLIDEYDGSNTADYR